MERAQGCGVRAWSLHPRHFFCCSRCARPEPVTAFGAGVDAPMERAQGCGVRAWSLDWRHFPDLTTVRFVNVSDGRPDRPARGRACDSVGFGLAGHRSPLRRGLSPGC